MEAAEWYEMQVPGLGARFLDEAEATILKIRQHPLAYRQRWRNLRRANLPIFPYGVWYEADTDQIVIFAVLHGARHPRRVRERFRGERQRKR